MAQIRYIPSYAGLEDLKKILRQWNATKGFSHILPRDTQLLKDYLAAQHEYYEEDQFKESFTLLDSFDVNLTFIEDFRLIIKSFKLFPKAVWPIRFHNKFVSKLQSYGNPDELLYILSQVYMLACGLISTYKGGSVLMKGGCVHRIQTKTIPMNAFFHMKLMRERNLFFHIGVEKVPIVKNAIIKRYEFVQYMHFLDILGDQFTENKNKRDERINHFIQ